MRYFSPVAWAAQRAAMLGVDRVMVTITHTGDQALVMALAVSETRLA